MDNFLVAALYKFVAIEKPEDLQPVLLKEAKKAGIKGTLLLAHEGINGTISGSEENLRDFLAYLRADDRFADLIHKESWADTNPFRRMKVKLKKEIVTMGVSDIDPRQIVGTYVKPTEWNKLIQDPDVVVIDTRNDYEVAIGTFEGAVDPKTTAFREFPDWVANTDVFDGKKKVAMFCTGGIRCEKSTAYMKKVGFDEVYHLEGGILKYLEDIDESESLWRGDCFVFDERVSVGHGLEIGEYQLCRACRRPITRLDIMDEKFELGVACPACHGETSEEQKTRFRERQKQIELARARGERHIPVD